MKILLVRHGESEANVAHRINDDPARPVNLTERGRAQAEAASNELRAVRFTHAYASEFPRAQQTAKILLRHHACTLRIDARINERKTGMDGLPVEAFHELMRTDPLHIKPEHGESFLEQMERLRSFLTKSPRATRKERYWPCPRKPDPRRAGLDGKRPRANRTRQNCQLRVGGINWPAK